jgi:hypothetical protein
MGPSFALSVTPYIQLLGRKQTFVCTSISRAHQNPVITYRYNDTK